MCSYNRVEMKDVCFQKYIYSKCLESKLLGTRLYVLNFILSKIEESNDTMFFQETTYWHISRLDIAMNVGLDEQSVSTVLKFLKNNGFIKTFFAHGSKKLFIAPIIDICRDYLVTDIPVVSDNIEEEEVLFDYQEKKYSDMAENIIRKLVEKNRDLFKTRLPKNNDKPTACFTKACQFLDDIYNGDIFNSRLHITINTLNSNSFYINGWKDKLQECNHDWNKIHKLLNICVKNYRLMHDANRMPLKKAFPKSIDTWFEDYYKNNSYFIYSMNEPALLREKDDEKIADAIFDSLPVSAQKGGNRLFDLNPNMSDKLLWENVKNMVEWGNALCKYEHNTYYWINSGADIPSKFCDYLADNHISVSVVTLNIPKAILCNAPWVWFINDVITKYNLDSNIINYGTAEELKEYYEKRKA